MKEAKEQVKDSAKVSEKIANVVSAIAFILGMGVFAYMGVQNWLPFLLLVAGIAILLKLVLKGNHFDTIVTLIVFGGAFITSLLGFFGVVFLPSLFILGAVYFILRQFFSFKSSANDKKAARLRMEEENSVDDKDNM